MSKTPKFSLVGDHDQNIPLHQAFDPENHEFVSPTGAPIVTLVDGKVPLNQVPTGNTPETVALGDHNHTLVEAATLAHGLRTSDQVDEATAQPGEIWLVL
jgi:hypothetical protein